MNYSKDKWSLIGHEPRPEQVEIINEILSAMDKGYKNIILEAGTGTGKSAIATTISNYVENSYIVTMTNQLLQQYLHDFDYMTIEIKGRSNYICNYGGYCDKCFVKESNQQLMKNYREAMKQYTENPEKYSKPAKPEKHNLCGVKKDMYDEDYCPYMQALVESRLSENVITNYDFLYYAGNYAKMLPDRELIIFDESHNFEKKVMDLVIKTFNRKTIYKDYGIDIFDGIVEQGMTLKSIQEPKYWIGLCEKIIEIVQRKRRQHIIREYSHFDGDMREMLLKQDELVSQYESEIEKYSQMIKSLRAANWIIETPTKRQILNDETHLTKNKSRGLAVELKPLGINDYTEQLLHFGKTRLFMTGTLGDKNMFCKWIGIDPDETYYIYQKSPFPVENRPIIRDYTAKMSGRNSDGEPNWKNENTLLKIHDILEDHKGEKGVIHVSSNEQAWWVCDELRPYCHRYFKVVSGRNREQDIADFEEDEGSMVLIGAGIKDGIDLKDDKCRFQIIFKMPFPSLAGAQINIRKRHDPVWYIYQTVMPLMQAYGRGIRHENDYCTTYVLDSDFENLLNNYHYLFNEYFLEAVKDFSIPNQKVRVRRIPRKKAEAK